MTDTQAAQPADPGLVTETIAVLGAGGIIGFPVARNIARSGLPVRAWNRSRGNAAPLAADGAYLARSPRDAASGAGIVITMLADEDAVVRAMNGPDGALRALAGAQRPASARGGERYHPRQALWVQMSTIGETATRRCADLANRNGVGFVDAPVLGTRRPADEGRLVILESGPEGARHRLAPVFGAIGQRTIRAGEAGAGSRLKAIVNYLVLAVVEPGEAATVLDLPLIEALACRFAEAAKE
jgi:3-hydroxyisobutyrate dehydrogenase